MVDDDHPDGERAELDRETIHPADAAEHEDNLVVGGSEAGQEERCDAETGGQEDRYTGEHEQQAAPAQLEQGVPGNCECGHQPALSPRG